MARLDDIPEPGRSRLAGLPCPSFDATPFVAPGRPLAGRRIAIVSTAGLQLAGDRPFDVGDGSFRAIAQTAPAAEVTMSHVSSNFDRSGFYEDLDSMLPRSRLAELAADGTIGSVAALHFAFMGATAPEAMVPFADEAAAAMRADEVDTALLLPV